MRQIAYFDDLFFLPWEGSTIVGTTDRKTGSIVESTVEPPEQEIQWLLKEVETYLSPELHVRRADVALHVGENREYYTIQEYIEGAKELLAGDGQQQDPQLPSNIFLLTDDQNAIEANDRQFTRHSTPPICFSSGRLCAHLHWISLPASAQEH